MKQKHLISFLAIPLLVCTLLLASIPLSAYAAELSDAVSTDSREITLPNGTKTGVTLSQIQLNGSTYGADRVVNVAEFDLSDPRLSLEVLTGGQYATSTSIMTDIAADFNASNPEKTLLAAINGDLWMTSVHSHSGVAKKVLTVPRGVMIVEGEIWASQQIDQENAEATNSEKNTPAGAKPAMGVTYQNQPVFGSPDISVTVTCNGNNLNADGINRLPVKNAIILYNHRVESANYALDDAYEIELEVSGTSALCAGKKSEATVKAIYPANSQTRPAIGEKTLLLTARGSRIADLSEMGMQVGDKVQLDITLTDRMGNTELWQQVRNAIGGHMEPIVNGSRAVINPDTTAYPTSIIGYRNDGTLVLTTVTSAKENSRAALRFCDAYRFCTEMGLNTAFYLDGGGSTTFIALEEGSYRVRNNCSDGSQRPVINGIGVVWNNTPVCEKQGSLYHIRVPVDLSGITPTYLDGTLLHSFAKNPNQVNLSYDSDYNALVMKTQPQSNDPYVTVDFSQLPALNASSYRYVTIKLKTDAPARSQLSLYYATGSHTGAAGDRVITASVAGNTKEWQYITFDLGSHTAWKDTVNNIRVDLLDGATTKNSNTFLLGGMAFFNTQTEVNNYKQKEQLPAGALENYLVYLESQQPYPDPSVKIPLKSPALTTWSISLKGDIALHASYEIPKAWLDDHPTAKVTFAWKDGDTIVTHNAVARENTYTCHITPANIHATVRVCLMEGTAILQENEMSVAEYCHRVQSLSADTLGITQAQLAALTPLANAIIAYGNAADQLGDPNALLGTAPDFEGVSAAVITGNQDIFSGVQAVLHTKATLKLNLNTSLLQSDYRITVWQDGVTEPLKWGAPMDCLTPEKQLVITGISATDFHTPFTVTVTDSNGDPVAQIRFSLNSYLADLYEKTATASEKNLIAAAYLYGSAADGYLNASH